MGRSLTDRKIRETADKYSAHHYEHYPLVLDTGRGCWITNEETGQRYLDMIAGYSAVIFGRSGKYYSRLLDALNRQAKKLTLVTGSYYTAPYAQLCEKLTHFCNMDTVLMMNTGAEAVETALKIAKRYAYLTKGISENSAEIISCENNFHGRTQGVLSLSSNDFYRKHFGPFLPGCKSVPFDDFDKLLRAVNRNTAAFIVEPIQGEGGINIPFPNYLKKVENLCKENDILFILDEIQTGFGRTGTMFAHQEYGVKPDIMTVGKAISGGILPISAVLGRNEVMRVLDPGSHGSTFGGNPLACAVACEVIDILIEDSSFVGRARKIGEYFLSELQKIKSPAIKEVRGRGFLIGVELNSPFNADLYRDGLLKEGIMCGIAHERTLRFSPPLIITKREIDWALPKISKVLQETG